MKKIAIKTIGYDLYTLQQDLGPGEMIETNSYLRENFPKLSFENYEDALKYVCDFLGTQFRIGDWCLEEDLDQRGHNGWVLHIIVDKENKWANKKMISAFRKEKLELRDLLVNVFLETIDIEG